MGGLSRRGLLAATAALGACGRSAKSQTGAPRFDAVRRGRSGETPALRALAPFPIGAAVQSSLLLQPDYAALYARHFAQLTPDYEMKMEVVLQSDGGFDFAAADRLAAFAAAHDQRLHGHTLLWWRQDPAAFRALDGQPEAFGAALDRYILALVGRYRGRMASWDVVNEPLNVEGDGLNPCLWATNLGAEGSMVRAFQQAKAADPGAMLFLNEGGQERRPKKLDALMRLADRLRGQGAPIEGLGAELHVGVDLAPGEITRCLKTMASTGLAIHVSEFDCSMRDDRFGVGEAARTAAQARIYHEAMEAFASLPAPQRHAFTLWEARDRDTWLRTPDSGGAPHDTPLPFDDEGQPKPAFWALVDALDAAKRSTTGSGSNRNAD